MWCIIAAGVQSLCYFELGSFFRGVSCELVMSSIAFSFFTCMLRRNLFDGGIIDYLSILRARCMQLRYWLHEVQLYKTDT